MECQPVPAVTPEPVGNCLPASADQPPVECSSADINNQSSSSIQLDASLSLDCTEPENATGLLSSRIVPDDEPGTHSVTFCVTISVGFSTEDFVENLDASLQKIPSNSAPVSPTRATAAAAKLSKKIVEAPRDQRFLHCEYSLFPSDIQPVPTDVVLHGRIAAKIFTDQTDGKVVQTWNHGNTTWVSWSNRHTVTVTESLLAELANYSLIVHFWDDKEKLSARAKFDRPKAFKFSNDKQDDSYFDGVGVKPSVLRQFDNYQSHQQKRFLRLQAAMGTSPNDYRGSDFDNRLQTLLCLLDQSAPPERPVTSSVNPFEDAALKATADSEKDSKQASRPESMDRNKLDKKSAIGERSRKLSDEKKGKKDSFAADDNEICRVVIPFSKLFAGVVSITDRLLTRCDSITDSFVSVTLSEPLLSDLQREKHNPLVIQVHSATKMPSTPVCYRALASRCKPAYVKYSILGLPEHTSVGLPQSDDIYWDDIHVMLTGSIDRCRLEKWFASESFQIEVHDRDRIIYPLQPASTLFGEEHDDQTFGNINPINGLKTEPTFWDPYGIARFDLMGLLYGQTMLELQSQIINCSMPEGYCAPSVGYDGKLILPPDVTQGPVEPPLRPGHYIESGTSLKIIVRLAYPLTVQSHINSGPQLMAECPFGRLVVKFPANNSQFLSRVMSFITKSNAYALNLDRVPAHVIDTALTNYQLSPTMKRSSSIPNGLKQTGAVDVLTGFRVVDGDMHLIVVEGFQAGAVGNLAQYLSADLPPDAVLMYHSKLNFQRCYYRAFDVDILCIQLSYSLTAILSQPLIYLRQMTSSLTTLNQLHTLAKCTRLRDAVRNEAFPSAEAIVRLSREFGQPITVNHFEVDLTTTSTCSELQPQQPPIDAKTQQGDAPVGQRQSRPPSDVTVRGASAVGESSVVAQGKERPPTEKTCSDGQLNVSQNNNNYNNSCKTPCAGRDTGIGRPSADGPLADVDKRTPSGEQIQPAATGNISEHSVTRTGASDAPIPSTTVRRPANIIRRNKLNVSKLSDTVTQRRSQTAKAYVEAETTDIALEKIRSIIRNNDPNHFYTYSSEFHHSATLPPTTVEKCASEEERQSREQWMTSDGWRTRSKITWQHWNRNRRVLDSAKLDELHVPRDQLHVASAPTAPVRSPMPWSMRQSDMNIWSKAPEVAQVPACLRQGPYSPRKFNDNDEFPEAEGHQVHRQSSKTELKERGRGCSNQLDRLAGLLKDSPKRYILCRYPVNVPALSVVNYPSIGKTSTASSSGKIEAERVPDDVCHQGYTAGPLHQRSLLLANNHIPLDDPRRRQQFIDQHGRDFNSNHRQRNKLYRRDIDPLSKFETTEYKTAVELQMSDQTKCLSPLAAAAV